KALNIEQTIAFFAPTFSDLSENLNSYMVEKESERLVQSAEKLTQSGVPADLATRIVALSSLFSVMDLAEVANNSGRSID
ncbi:hypothetical protein ACKI1O_53070, partial [Streptomyces scabiei]